MASLVEYLISSRAKSPIFSRERVSDSRHPSLRELLPERARSLAHIAECIDSAHLRNMLVPIPYTLNLAGQHNPVASDILSSFEKPLGLRAGRLKLSTSGEICFRIFFVTAVA